MNILSNSIIQDLIQNVYKGVTETFNYVLERYNSNDVFAYSLYIDDYCSYLGWAANTISHYEIEKLNYPKEEHPFIKWYYPQFAIGLGEVPEKIDSIFNNEIQNILNDANTLISEDNFEQYQAEVYDSIIEGFKKAIASVDKEKIKNIIFFVSIADSDNAEIMEKNPEAYESFLHQEEKFKNAYTGMDKTGFSEEDSLVSERIRRAIEDRKTDEAISQASKPFEMDQEYSSILQGEQPQRQFTDEELVKNNCRDALERFEQKCMDKSREQLAEANEAFEAVNNHNNTIQFNR